MKFGPRPLAEAEGAILAHATSAKDMRGGGPAGRVYQIGKGTRLTAQHLDDLRAQDVAEVIVAQLGPEDLHEDAAAAAIAAALCGPGLAATQAATGRVNLRAEGPGIVALDRTAIDAVNRIDPAVTVATVAEWQRLGPRGLAATIKIIPFAAPRAAVEAAVALGAVLRLLPPVFHSASLIETEIGAPLSEKGRAATAERLARLEVGLSDRVIVPHRAEAIAGALRAAPGEMLLILTGSATSDAEDVGPEAVRAAGGEIFRYGMPVDPGNLIFTGRIGARPVIGLPGCARSPALNGADWVMERVICGLAPEHIDIPGMGVGGLLKEIPSRPRPRDTPPQS